MNLRNAILVLGLAVASPHAGSAQEAAATETVPAGPRTTAAAVHLEDKSGAEAEITGIVIESAFDRFVVVRDHTDLVMVRIDKEHAALSLKRGDIVRVTGTVLREFTTRNNVVAKSVELVSRGRDEAPTTWATNIAQVLTRRDGELVTLTGTVNGQKDQFIFVKDASGEIAVDLGQRWRETTYKDGDLVGAVGEVDTELQFKRVVRAVSAGKIDRFVAEAQAGPKPVDVKKAVAGHTPGDKVVVRGRVAEFIGMEKLYFLFDGQNILIIRPSEGDKETRLRAGEMLEVSGTIAAEVHEGKQYGAITEAKIKRLQ